MEAKHFQSIVELSKTLRNTIKPAHKLSGDVVSADIELNYLSRAAKQLEKHQIILEYLTSKGGDDAEIKHYSHTVAGYQDELKAASKIESRLKQIEAALKAEQTDKAAEAATGKVNPWMPETINLTDQGRIITENPAMAAAMITAAGRKPETYGLEG